MNNPYKNYRVVLYIYQENKESTKFPETDI